MSSSVVGLLIGLLLALITVAGGFTGFLLAIVMGAAGFAIGAQFGGDLDLRQLLRDRRE